MRMGLVTHNDVILSILILLRRVRLIGFCARDGLNPRVGVSRIAFINIIFVLTLTITRPTTVFLNTRVSKTDVTGKFYPITPFPSSDILFIGYVHPLHVTF